VIMDEARWNGVVSAKSLTGSGNHARAATAARLTEWVPFSWFVSAIKARTQGQQGTK
jgi:hypothetical protein